MKLVEYKKLVVKPDGTKVVLFALGGLLFAIGASLMAIFHFHPDLKGEGSLDFLKQVAYILNSGGLYSAFLGLLRNGKSKEKATQAQTLTEVRILAKRVKRLEKKGVKNDDERTNESSA